MTRLFLTVRPPYSHVRTRIRSATLSLYGISPLPVVLTRLVSSASERSYDGASLKRKYCSVYASASHLIRRDHSNWAVIKERFRRFCSCLSLNNARLKSIFLSSILWVLIYLDSLCLFQINFVASENKILNHGICNQAFPSTNFYISVNLIILTSPFLSHFCTFPSKWCQDDVL